MQKRITYFFIAATAAFIFGSGHVYSQSPCMECPELLSRDFGPDVSIDSVALIPDSDRLPGHCMVKGTQLPENKFIIKLPTEWNGRYFQGGNRGAAGLIQEDRIDFGLFRGYAAAGANGGHEGSTNLDSSFCLNDPTGERLNDYCYGSVHKMNQLGKRITTVYYCREPKYAYYTGCSTGGRQGMIEAQRYPDDFDGIMTGDPLVSLTATTMRDTWNAQVTAQVYIPPEKHTLLADAVMKKCDRIDGLTDGVIDDPRDCPFNALSDLPACEDGLAPCFTAGQRTVLQKLYDGPRNSSGMLLYQGFAPGSEQLDAWYGLTIPTAPGEFSVGAKLGEGFVRDCALYPESEGSGWDLSSFDLDSDWPFIMDKLSAKCDANDPNLLPFMKNGRKLIQYHGSADPLVSPLPIMAYYDSVVNFLGQTRTDQFYKLYMIPGMFHCNGGLGASNDAAMFDALVDWVENGIEPGALTGLRAGDPDSSITSRTRPMCPYPDVARYLGQGSIDDAANFTCARRISADVRMPPTLNLPGNDLFQATMLFPTEYEIDKNWKIIAVVCEGALARQPLRFSLKSRKSSLHLGSLAAKFDTSDLVGIQAGRSITFTMTSLFEYKGKRFSFEGRRLVDVYLAP